MRTLAADRLSIPAYGIYLALQWRLHAPLEALLMPWTPNAWSGMRLRKSDWLRQDLQAIGVAPAEPIGACFPVDSWARSLGILYVLEGSTLGLQVVRKRWQDEHPGMQSAGRFVLGYGTHTGRRWREFLMRLESLEEVDWPLAEEAACATFDHFLQAFSRVSAEDL